MKRRTGFTLIEMLVVMSLIILLAGLAVAFLPGVNDQQRAARGATMLQGYLAIAKQKAFQRRSIYGLRLTNTAGNGIITDFQYIEKPDDLIDFAITQIGQTTGTALVNVANTAGITPGMFVSAPTISMGAVVVAINSPTQLTISPAAAAGGPFPITFRQWLTPGLSGNGLQMDLYGVDLWNGQPPSSNIWNGSLNQTVGQPFWTVQPGDYLEILGVGTVHRILNPDRPNNIYPGVVYPGILNQQTYSSMLLESTPDPHAPFFHVQIAGNPNPTGGFFTLIITINTPSGTASPSAVITYPTNEAAIQTAIDNVLRPIFYPTLPPASAPATARVTAASGGWDITFLIPVFVTSIQLTSDSGTNLTYPAAPPPPPSPRMTITGPNFRFPPVQPINYYRIRRAPRIGSEEQLQLPKDIVVDLTTNVTYLNGPLPVNVSGDIDILFSPSGAMITPGFNQEFLALWVRDKTTVNPPFEGSPTLISIHTRTGLISAHPPNDSGSDPYSFIKDGRAN